MKTKLPLLCVLGATTQTLFSQGFVNLDFECANVAGYGFAQAVPTSDALPGWSAYGIIGGTTTPITGIIYDGISLGGAFIAIDDNKDSNGGPIVFQGNYSATLWGSSFAQDGGVATEISQTGLVPNGTMSITMDVQAFYNFQVTLGGQVINMVPLQTFSNYTLYGGNISSFAGSVENLSVIAPPTGVPNGVEVDDIHFSPTAVPEPSSWGLAAVGALLLSCRTSRKDAR